MLEFLNSKVEDTWLLELLKVTPSVVVAAFAGWIGWRQYQLAKKEKDFTGDARYLAIRIICILDPYISDCASVAASSRRADQDGFVAAPDTPKYPDDVNWKSIDSNLMYRILSLQVAADRADLMMSAVAEHCTPEFDDDQYFEERTRQYGALGLQAHSIIQALRKQYGASLHVAQHPYWNPVETLQREVEKQKKVDQERAAEWARKQKDLPPAPDGNLI